MPGYVLSGPAAGNTSTPIPYVIVPTGIIPSDTVVLSSDDGGSFSPSTLIFNNSSLYQTTFFTPVLPVGTVNVSASSANSYPIAGSPLAVAITAPMLQSVGWPDFYQAVLAYLSGWGLFGPQSTMWVIDPDDKIEWPVGASPFALLVPGDMNPMTNDGMGRFGKLWNTNITIYIVVQNIADQSYSDTTAVQSSDTSIGAYNIVSSLVDAMEQAYIVTPLGRYATTEMPEATRIGTMERFKEANNYIRLPVSFRITVCESLPSTILSTGLPD